MTYFCYLQYTGREVHPKVYSLNVAVTVQMTFCVICFCDKLWNLYE